jgi:hypothetical protein
MLKLPTHSGCDVGIKIRCLVYAFSPCGDTLLKCIAKEEKIFILN